MQHFEDFEFRGDYRPEWHGISLWLVTQTMDGGQVCVARLKDEPEIHDKGLIVEPTMNLTSNHAQQLTDILHREGFRPRDGTGGPAQVEALRAHLEDMRRAYEVLLVQMKAGG